MRRLASSPAVTRRAREAINSSRACALAIAVATSSAKSASRVSVWGGCGSCPGEAMTAAPQSRPSTRMGAPTAERMPSPRTAAAIGPAACSWLSIRAVVPLLYTIVATFSPSIGNTTPTGIFCSWVVSWAATTSHESLPR